MSPCRSPLPETSRTRLQAADRLPSHAVPVDDPRSAYRRRGRRLDFRSHCIFRQPSAGRAQVAICSNTQERSQPDSSSYSQSAPGKHPRGRETASGTTSPGTHAAALAVSVPASRARDALLGGTSQAEDSFPRTEVRHLDPIRIFRAAFWSRSCDSPQSLHTHDLTINPLTPRGPLSAPQVEQVTLVFRSLMTANVLAACWLL